MSDYDKDIWDEIKAWNVPPEKLSAFLHQLRGYPSPFSSRGVSDERNWATDINVYKESNFFVVTARTCPYAFCDNDIREYL